MGGGCVARKHPIERAAIDGRMHRYWRSLPFQSYRSIHQRKVKMKRLALIVSLAIVVALAGCSASQIQAAGGNVAAVNGAAAGALQTVATSIVAACPAGEAFASAAAAATANPDVALAQDANGLFCALNKAIVATAPASGVPAASAPVAASSPAPASQ